MLLPFPSALEGADQKKMSFVFWFKALTLTHLCLTPNPFLNIQAALTVVRPVSRKDLKAQCPFRRYRKAYKKVLNPHKQLSPRDHFCYPYLYKLNCINLNFLLKVNLTQVASILETPFISDI